MKRVLHLDHLRLAVGFSEDPFHELIILMQISPHFRRRVGRNVFLITRVLVCGVVFYYALGRSRLLPAPFFPYAGKPLGKLLAFRAFYLVEGGFRMSQSNGNFEHWCDF